MVHIPKLVFAIIILLIIIGTGAAGAIIGDLGKAMGGLGVLLGIILIFGIAFAVFDKK